MTRVARRESGLIPAHAGSTSLCYYPAFSCRAHPRSRGEHVGGLHPLVRGVGSSPLTRGAPSGVFQFLMGVRLIPAHAGSTHLIPDRLHARGAHPRSRGEHRMDPVTNMTAARLIPAHAGSTGCWRFVVDGGGLIPAHAGSTLPARLACPGRRAHPRSRGEHLDSARKASA